MSLRSSILLRATRQSNIAFRRNFLDSASRNLNMSALGDNSAAITNALNTSGTIPIETFTITFRDLSDESVERTLRGMADGDAASQLQFDELVKELRSENVDEYNELSDEFLINESYILGEWDYQ